MMTSRFSGFTFWGILASVLFTVSMGYAGEEAPESYEGETLTVTSRKVEEKVKDVPASLSVFDGMMLKDNSIDGIDELTYFVPNLSFDKLNTHETTLSFRGIGGLPSMNKVWLINVDGVAIPYVALDTFLDTERVEVLRAGQGALYGRNTQAGVVNIITKDPGETPEFEGGISYGSYNSMEARAIFSTPLTDQSGIRAAFKASSSDGYFENDFHDADDTNDDTQYTGAIKYTHRAGDSDVELSVFADSYDSGYDTLVPLAEGPSYTTHSNETGKNKGSHVTPILTFNREMGIGTLTSVTSYTDSEYEILSDFDFSEKDIYVFGYEENYNTFSQEARLAGKTGSVSWLGGIYGMYEELDLETDMTFGQDAPMMQGMTMQQVSTVDTLNFALFGEVKWDFASRWQWAASLRANYESKGLDWDGPMGSSLDMDESWSALLPAMSLNYAVNAENNVYTAISTGYHAGDYSANQVQKEMVEQVVDPEYAVTYEIGWKSELMENRLRANAAVFYTDWRDMQVNVTSPGGQGGMAISRRENAGEAHSIGFESDVSFRPVQAFELNAALGIIDIEFDDYETNKTTGTNLKGNKIPNTPEYKFTLGSTYFFDGGFFMNGNASFVGETYLDELNTIKQDPYTLMNASVGYETEHWTARVYGKNLLDEEFYVHQFNGAGRAGDPLTVGAEVSVRL